MNIPKKYQLVVVAIFAIYNVLAIFLLYPFTFLQDHTPWISFLSMFLVSFLLALVVIKLGNRTFYGPFRQLLIIGSIFSISLIAGVFIYLINYSSENETFMYLSSFLILAIPPISIYILWLIYSDLQTRVVVTAERRENTDDSIDKIFRITNEKDEVILEIPIHQIVTFEANDNYVVTYQLMDDGSLDKKLHRISMKKITELLDQIDVEFFRVHKSYLINPRFIEKLKGKSQAYRIVLSHLSKEIPISRSFDVERIKK